MFTDYILEATINLVGDESYLDDYLAYYDWEYTDYYFVGQELPEAKREGGKLLIWNKSNRNDTSLSTLFDIKVWIKR